MESNSDPVIDEAREQGAQLMLDAVRTSLREWPRVGIDIEVAKAVIAIRDTAVTNTIATVERKDLRDRIATHMLPHIVDSESEGVGWWYARATTTEAKRDARQAALLAYKWADLMLEVRDAKE